MFIEVTHENAGPMLINTSTIHEVQSIYDANEDIDQGRVVITTIFKDVDSKDGLLSYFHVKESYSEIAKLLGVCR